MKLVEIIWIAAIGSGIAAIFKIASYFPTNQFEIALNSMIISLSILSLIWIHIARTSLSEGSSLRRFSSYIFLCLIFMFLFSISNLIIKISDLNNFYWDYIWLGIAYSFLIVSCYKLMRIGTEFGFSVQAKGIKKLIDVKSK